MSLDLNTRLSSSTAPSSSSVSGSAEVFQLAQASGSSSGSVRFNIFDLGMAPRLPQDIFSRAVRGLADGIGHVVGEIFGIPEGTEASRQAPMLVHELRQRGIEVSPTGDVSFPNTPEGGATFADLVLLSHAPGDLSIYPGLHGLQRFRDPTILENAGFSDAFIEGFLGRADTHVRSAGFTALAAFWGLSGGVAGARNSSPYRELTRRINEREAQLGAIDLQRGADGVYRAPGSTGQARSNAGSPNTGAASQGGALVRQGGGAVTQQPGAGAPPSSLATGAGQIFNPGSPSSGSIGAGLSGSLGAGARQVFGPADAAGIANWRRQVENDAAARTRALDAASRANPVPALPGVRTPDVGPYDWNQVGDVARQFNANSPDRLEVAVRVPVDRNYGGELGSRREVGLLVGSPFALADQVAAMQRNGQIPRDFDLAGAARQAGVDWNGAVQAEANLRAQRVAAENPITLAGNRTYLAADRADAVAAAQNFNRGSSGADLIAVPVAVNRTVSSGATSATGVSHEVWVGSPDQLSNFYETLSGQGRLAGNPSYADLQRDAGISGSFPGRVAAARDLRAAQREIADPTTLFGSTVGVQASAGAAQREVLAFNRNPVPADHLQLYVPLTRDVSGPGLPANARGTAHAVYQGPAENLRGFYDEMNRQGRIPQGVSFDQLLQQSGIQGTYRERIAQRDAQAQTQTQAAQQPPLSTPLPELDNITVASPAAPQTQAPAAPSIIQTPGQTGVTGPNEPLIWTPGASSAPIKTGADLQNAAELLRRYRQETGHSAGDIFVSLLNREIGGLPRTINDIHSHEGPNVLGTNIGPGFGSYDPRYQGVRPPGLTDAEWTDMTIDRLIEQSRTMGDGDTVFFPVAPRFNERPAGSTGMLPDGVTPTPDYYLQRRTTGDDPNPQTILGVLRVNRAEGIVVTNEMIYDRYGQPAVMPFQMSIRDFEELIGRSIDPGVETIEFVSSPAGCQLHFSGTEVDAGLADNFAAMIRRENQTRGTNLIAERYVLGLTAGNPREDGSYRNVFDSLQAVNEAEQRFGLQPGSIRVLWGETNLSKEIVHSLGGQTPLVHNTPEELANLTRWAQAMGQSGMPVVIHCDSGTPAETNRLNTTGSLAALRLPSNNGNIEALIAFANSAPDTDVIWAHAGLGYTVQAPRDYTDQLRRVLESAPNVRIDVSWDAIHPYIAEDPAAWARLMAEYPDRFLFGSDTIATTQNPLANSRRNVAESMERTGLLRELDLIDPNLKEALFSENYNEFVRPGLQRAIEFRTHPENAEWLRNGAQGPAPFIWQRGPDGRYLDQLIRNPALGE